MPLATGLLLWSVAASAGAQTAATDEVRYRELGLQEALDEAHRGNSDLEVAHSREAEAHARSRAATAPLYPRVDLELGYVATTDPVGAFGIKLRQENFGMDDLAIDALNNPDAVDDFSTRVRATWSIGSAQMWAARDAAAHQAESASWQTRRTREAIETKTRVLYYNAQRAEAQVEAARSALEASEATVKRFQSRHEEGVLTQADLRQAEAERSSARARLIRAETERQDARLRLGLHLGWESDVLPVPRTELAPARTLERTELDPEARADLRARAEALEAADVDRTRARFGYVPDLQVFASYALHDDTHPFGADGTNWTAGVALKWTIFGGLQRAAEVEQAEARLNSARAQYEQAQRESRGEVQRARRSVEAAREALQATESAQGAAQEGRDLMRRRFEEGLATASDLLQAEARVVAMHARHIDALATYHMAVAQLDFALGGGAVSEEVSP